MNFIFHLTLECILQLLVTQQLLIGNFETFQFDPHFKVKNRSRN